MSVKIRMTSEMRTKYLACVMHGAESQIQNVLEAMEPEAKRDLAAQLLRSASTDEGFSEV